MDTPTPLIHGKLAAVLGEVGAIEKDRQNAFHKFKFRGVDDVYNTLHPIFARHAIYVRPEVIEAKQTERNTKGEGTQLHAVVRMRYHFTTTDGSSVPMEMTGEAADSGDKSLGKAAQYAYKVLLLQAFLIPTEGDNDPDAHAVEWGAAQRQQTAPRQPPRPPRQEQPAPPVEHAKDPYEAAADALRKAATGERIEKLLAAARESREPTIRTQLSKLAAIAAERYAELSTAGGRP